MAGCGAYVQCSPPPRSSLAADIFRRHVLPTIANCLVRSTARPVQAANGYATATAACYGGFLQRIAVAARQLSQRSDVADAEIVGLVTTMLDERPRRRR